jgi:hypothetical protein
VGKKLALTKATLSNQAGIDETVARLRQLAEASGLELADEVGWELLADKCEESGEPEAVVHLALATAWRVVLSRLHGLLEPYRGIMPAVGRLKQAPSSTSISRCLDEVSKGITEDTRGYGDHPVAPLLEHTARAVVERATRLRDRLAARGVLRDK